ncbi:hypothetical protein BC828DRAFT_430691 [Blastocladiella britannica]|nr:hypothetical protein BC828DRAFT_430691 [Blastocladiella britannica]
MSSRWQAGSKVKHQHLDMGNIITNKARQAGQRIGLGQVHSIAAVGLAQWRGAPAVSKVSFAVACQKHAWSVTEKESLQKYEVHQNIPGNQWLPARQVLMHAARHAQGEEGTANQQMIVDWLCPLPMPIFGALSGACAARLQAGQWMQLTGCTEQVEKA